MKKMLSFVLCIILTLSLMACNAQVNEKFSDEDIASVTYYVTKRYIEHDTGDVTVDEYAYDDEWNLLSMKLYLNGTFQSSVEYEYNKDKSVIKTINTSSNSEITVSEVRQIFDESGKLVEASSYSDGEFAGSTEYYYDDEDRQIKLITKHANSDMVITISYDYDKNGNQTLYGIDTGYYTTKKEHLYNEENKIYRTDDYRNDELINRTEYRWEGNTRYGEVYDAGEQLIAKNIYIFDDAGNTLVEEIYSSTDVLKQRICYEYIGTDGTVSSGIKDV